MNRTSHRKSPRAGTLIVTLLVITLLALIAAHTLRRVDPKLRMAYQTAGWQEARLAAEAGIDVAMGELARNATSAPDGPWTGWKTQDSSGARPVNGSILSSTLAS
ncbi:MAG TPA: hypothetical protein VEO95_11300 [Chthoniobacteraceae bacterium]|nr:hypothetical protein [Chthoniobacteraceae bacterium]